MDIVLTLAIDVGLRGYCFKGIFQSVRDSEYVLIYV